jgi:hypothetical protein
VTDAELRVLLADCLTLWDVKGHVVAGDDAMEIRTVAGRFALRRAGPSERPIRWFLRTPDRDTAGRGPRALPSIVAVLNVLRRESAGG